MAEPVPGRARSNPGRANNNGPASWALCPDAGPLSRAVVLYDQLCSWENLLLAYRRASKGKRGQAAVATFEHRLEENLLELQAELRARTYTPGRYNSFYIHEPKRRLISAAPFRDRVVHHALCQLIEPLLERTFIHDSYANRVGKGTHRALDRAQAFARRWPFVLQCDVRQFFPSIDHGIVAEKLAHLVADADVRRLIGIILSSGNGVLEEEYRMVYFVGDDLLAAVRPRGLPIGNLTSQLWANAYLSSFDHFVKRELRCQAYLRYVDDFLLFSDAKASLWRWREAIIKLMAGQQEGVLPFSRVSASVRGWVNHVRYANSIGLRKAILRGMGSARQALI